MIRSHLKNRILAQSQGGTEFQPADILKYFEELKRDPNPREIGYAFHRAGTETCSPQADWVIRRRPSGYALTRKTFLRWLLAILYNPQLEFKLKG